MFIIIEIIEGEPQTPWLLPLREQANLLFDQIIKEQEAQEYTVTELAREADGTFRLPEADETLRIVGDDSWSLQLFETPVQSDRWIPGYKPYAPSGKGKV